MDEILVDGMIGEVEKTDVEESISEVVEKERFVRAEEGIVKEGNSVKVATGCCHIFLQLGREQNCKLGTLSPVNNRSSYVSKPGWMALFGFTALWWRQLSLSRSAGSSLFIAGWDHNITFFFIFIFRGRVKRKTRSSYMLLA